MIGEFTLLMLLFLLLILFLLTGATGSITALADVIFPSETFLTGLLQDFDPNSELLTRMRILHPIVASALSIYLYLEANRLEREYKIITRHIKVLVKFLKSNGFPIESSHLRSRKQEEVLHKPISNLKELLENIQSYNKPLYICALLTYGCLLRPHQEIRCLKWRDFSDDLSLISLSGNKVKSKRNRVVPVPEYIRKELTRGDVNNNIFTDTSKPYNNSYFKGIWRRFKKALPSVEQGITLYSFRHTGAIEIYKRTGSLSKLQKAMGHSSLKVSLTYLRGLEVEDLKEEDMPMV